MRLSTSTNVMHLRRNGRLFFVEDCMARCRAAGFTVMDMNFCDIADGQPLTKPDWREWAGRIRRGANALGIEFSQSRAPFYHAPLFYFRHACGDSNESRAPAAC